MTEFEGKPSLEPRNLRSYATNEVISVARLYAEVFAGPPWNEVTRCGCNKFFGRGSSPGDGCPCTKTTLEEAYPVDETAAYIKKEVEQDGAIKLVLEQNNEYIGFGWGFPYQSPTIFALRKYSTPEMQNIVRKSLYEEGIDGKFFYFSECGVKQERRGQGLSTELSKTLITKARWEQLPVIMRTNWQSPMIAIADRFGMKQIMGPESVVDRTTRQIVPTGRIINTIDKENSDRVLFVLK